ncbi:hypothetical protein I545_6817 [Mycobacterium kansasii 662]|uniref:Uncharacterized protein n=1 Tax=Mycobacterium kansasii 662 TaxID=1299326 RepID=X7XRH5_MYCKA|nr:hypothetical protein I545_6817 [Mycobacterium kansasii 662]
MLEAHRELELLDHVAAARDNSSRLQVLVNEAPRVLRVSWCTVLHSSEGALHRLAAAGRPGNPRRFGPLAADRTRRALDGGADWVPRAWRDMDTTMVAAPLGDPHMAVVLGRPARNSGL